MKSPIYTIIGIFLFSTAIQSADAAYPFTAYSRKGANKWNRSWTPAMMKELNSVQKTFEQARDLEEFCPGYRLADAGAKRNCWIRLVTGISSYESGNKESILGDGGKAAGLLQIWAMNCKNMGMGSSNRAITNALKRAPNNLKCGIQLMKRRVAADGYIAKEYKKQGRHKARTVRLGLGHMGWTTMRNPFYYKGRKYGHRLLIQKGMQLYKNPKTGSLALRYVNEDSKLLG
ncbi:MAG: hypothetical protein M9962_08545 [Oligoflexia bacterium]|nr:hypothetical protein [Oligoflexia bacterium]